jgi:hypothetical protein
VRRVLAAQYKHDSSNRGPSWLTTIGHAKDSLWSVDLFRCESILLKSHWVMVVMDQYTRRTIGFGVHAGNVDGPALCRMSTEATSRQGWPAHISSDNDPLFQYHRWKANLRALDIEEIKSLPHVPMSHPFVEDRAVDYPFDNQYQCSHTWLQNGCHCPWDFSTIRLSTDLRVLAISRARFIIRMPNSRDAVL